MARTDVYLYTNATDPADAVVTAQQTTTSVDFPTLVLGDTPLFNFYFTDGTASWPSFAGDAAYSVTWALSDAIAGDDAPYALQTASTPITGGWSIRLPLNTGRLINELQAKKVSQAWPVVQLWQHIRVTDASGYVESYAMIRTNVRLRAIGETQVTPDDPLPAGTQYVLADETGALSEPANFFANSGVVTTSGTQSVAGQKTFSDPLTAGSTLSVGASRPAGTNIFRVVSDTGDRIRFASLAAGSGASIDVTDLGETTTARQLALGASNGTVSVPGKFIVATSTPANASATGTAGTVAWDSSYIYICTATNTWKRVAIATW